MLEQTDRLSTELRTLREEVRQLTRQTTRPSALEIIGGGLLAVGTAMNFAGALILAAQ